RHTRFDCDWSSDVCSADLGMLESLAWNFAYPGVPNASHNLPRYLPGCNLIHTSNRTIASFASTPAGARSRRWGLAKFVKREGPRSEEHTSELQSQSNLVCR